jgi:hypothetical protein
MSRRTFHLTLDGQVRKVQVEHGYWSGRRVVRVDGLEVLRVEPRSLRERDDLWQTSTEHPFEIGAHHLVLRVRPGVLTYDIDLIVDGRSAIDGLPAGPLRPPANGRYPYTLIKIGIAGIAFIAYLFIVIGPFGAFARGSGPRWILVANVLVDTSVPIFVVILVVFAWQTRQRVRNVALALVLLALAIFVFREGFLEAADLLYPFDEETIVFNGWEPGPLDLRRVTLLDGPEVEFANDMPVRWRRLPPGTYVLGRGHLSRVIFDMREATSAAN